MPPSATPPAAPADAPLPRGWERRHDEQGQPYFWHAATRKTSWDRPPPEPEPEPRQAPEPTVPPWMFVARIQVDAGTQMRRAYKAGQKAMHAARRGWEPHQLQKHYDETPSDLVAMFCLLRTWLLTVLVLSSTGTRGERATREGTLDRIGYMLPPGDHLAILLP